MDDRGLAIPALAVIPLVVRGRLGMGVGLAVHRLSLPVAHPRTERLRALCCLLAEVTLVMALRGIRPRESEVMCGTTSNASNSIT